MRKELDDKLCKKYPKLFAQRRWPMTKTLMCWGFDCGDGWYDLINRLCARLQKHIDESGCGQVEVVQVKEKYGAARFYVNAGDEKTWAMIHRAERRSGAVCEECGQPGELAISQGWYKTLCRKHRRAMKYWKA